MPKTNDAKTLHKRRRPPTRTTPRIRTTLKMPNNRNVIFEGQNTSALVDTGAGYSVEWEALTPPSEVTTLWVGPEIRSTGGHLIMPVGRRTARVEIHGEICFVKFVANRTVQKTSFSG